MRRSGFIMASAFALAAGSASAASLEDTFFSMSTCKTLPTMSNLMDVYSSAEKKYGQPKTEGMVAIFKLPKPVKKGAVTFEALYATNGGVGVVVPTSSASAFAKTYKLARESGDKPVRTAVVSAGYSRRVADGKEHFFEDGAILQSAVELKYFPGKTFLGCEFIRKDFL